MVAAPRAGVQDRRASEALVSGLGVSNLVVMACAAAIGAYGVGRHRHDEELAALRAAALHDAPSAEERNDDAEALGLRIEALEGAYRACLASRAPDVPVPSTRAATPAPARSVPAPVPETASRLDLAERTFEGESVDPAWGQEHTEALKNEALANLAVDSRLVKVECRTSLCRIDLTHPSIEASNAFIEKMFIGPDALEKAPFMAGAPEVIADGTRSVALLVGRADGAIAAQ
jgi:hypothetical protein